MHCQKHLPSTALAAQEITPATQRYRFSPLDWIAAFFVVATPIFIAYRLIIG